MNLIFVALGGAVGALLRYSIGLIPYSAPFPILTLIINFLGAVIIGVVAGASEVKDVNSSLSLFIKTGVCGGFTTFSTFSLEAVNLLRSGQTALSVIYAVVSVVLCVLGVLLGMYISKLAFSK